MLDVEILDTLLKQWSNLGAKHVYCLDLGNKWKRELKKGLKNKGVPLSKISFISGSVTNIPLNSEMMDFTACNGVLYHLPTKSSSSKALKELFRKNLLNMEEVRLFI